MAEETITSCKFLRVQQTATEKFSYTATFFSYTHLLPLLHSIPRATLLCHGDGEQRLGPAAAAAPPPVVLLPLPPPRRAAPAPPPARLLVEEGLVDGAHLRRRSAAGLRLGQVEGARRGTKRERENVTAYGEHPLHIKQIGVSVCLFVSILLNY